MPLSDYAASCVYLVQQRVIAEVLDGFVALLVRSAGGSPKEWDMGVCTVCLFCKLSKNILCRSDVLMCRSLMARTARTSTPSAGLCCPPSSETAAICPIREIMFLESFWRLRTS